MKRFLVGLTLFSCHLVSAHALCIGYGPAGRIAKSDLPGKGTPGQCLVFANALHARFEAAGIPSRVVTYTWDESGAEAPGHAIVVYEDRGRIYAMDNTSFSPRWLASGEVTKASSLALARQWSGPMAPPVRFRTSIPDELRSREIRKIERFAAATAAKRSTSRTAARTRLATKHVATKTKRTAPQSARRQAGFFERCWRLFAGVNAQSQLPHFRHAPAVPLLGELAECEPRRS